MLRGEPSGSSVPADAVKALLCMQKPCSQLCAVMSSVTAGEISSGEGFCVCQHLVGEILCVPVVSTPSMLFVKPGRSEVFYQRTCWVSPWESVGSLAAAAPRSLVRASFQSVRILFLS